MEIRDARPEDWPAVWAFARPVIESGEHFVWEPGTPEDRLRAYWIEKEPPASALVAEADGRVAGIAEIHPNQPGRGAHIANAGFMVDPAVRGRGLGRALGEAALARAKADGFAAMQFNAVVATNTAAVELWHSLGFRTLALLPATFRHPSKGLVDMHLMFREL
ncbi:GNAT family N-acetyltransferase [Glycomyces artemisiae]|uniref:L-amino acid N-acyltransferase YncA n=1 Tax=Glycomyces artemisiae TaxID=1076443 RepID=A0A2T0UWM4_9ACTN|nr:GNAT family N-acetyltransferase [Glycomyces artemisiae]PRY62294.1 L-amino acid N-acyltransferase YncA [Glycomyces artemisiae]